MADGNNETSLITIEKADALTVFTTPHAIDPLLAKVREKIDAFVGDASTEAGRKRIASIAYSVARSKTYLDGVGKDLVAIQKEIPNKIDATRRTVRDTLDKWRDEVRKPLTDWESAEDTRVASHKRVIQRIVDAGNGRIDGEPASFDELFHELRTALIPSAALEEFADEAERLHAAALAQLTTLRAEHDKREAEQAELKRLRAEAAEREKADREAAMMKLAEERAIAAAEKAAAIEHQRLEAEIAAERAAAARKETALKFAAELAQRQAREEADAIAAKARREAQEQAEREADFEHRRDVNRTARDGLMAGGLDEDAATLAVKLIASGTIPNVRIHY